MPVLQTFWLATAGICRTSRVRLLLINSFHKLSDHQWNTLYPLNLLLCSNQLSLKTPLHQIRQPITSCLATNSGICFTFVHPWYIPLASSGICHKLVAKAPKATARIGLSYSRCLWYLLSAAYSSPPSFPAPSSGSMFGIASAGPSFLWGAIWFAGFSIATSPIVRSRRKVWW